MKKLSLNDVRAVLWVPPGLSGVGSVHDLARRVRQVLQGDVDGAYADRSGETRSTSRGDVHEPLGQGGARPGAAPGE